MGTNSQEMHVYQNWPTMFLLGWTIRWCNAEQVQEKGEINHLKKRKKKNFVRDLCTQGF